MKQAITPATDVYALASVAYECLTGVPPFTGESPVSVALAHVHGTPAPLPATFRPQSVRSSPRAWRRTPASDSRPRPQWQRPHRAPRQGVLIGGPGRKPPGQLVS
jgi:serine/threonine protein kinase